MRYLPVLALLLAAGPAAAQMTPDHPCWAAETTLDAGNVRATLLTDGSLFNDVGYRHGVYEVPKGSGETYVDMSSLWIAGLVGDTLHASASMWGEIMFRGGPLDADGRPPAACEPFNRFYEVRGGDLRAATSAGATTATVRDWPAHLGAPVIDGNGVPDDYDPDGGDRPALYGDQTIWWVMNDVAPALDTIARPTRYDAPPVRVEVRVAAFAFDVPGDLGNTTFFRYRITYRGDAPLDSAYVGFFADPDLHVYYNNYVGSDTTLDLGYAYSAIDAEPAPPAIGYTILRGPTGDVGVQRSMDAFVWLSKSGYFEHRWPNEPTEYYNTLQGRWSGGPPILTGGGGRAHDAAADPNAPTTFHFPGDPTTGGYWSMINVDDHGTAFPSLDVRFMLSSGPFSMQPGDTEEVWLAVVWARGTDHLDSVRELKQDVAYLHDIAESLFTPTNKRPVAVPASPPPLVFAPPFPNPAAERTTVRYSVPHAMPARLVLHDVLGREIAVLAGGTHTPGEHTVDVDVRGLAPGTYFVRLALYGTAFTRPLVVVR